MADGTPEKDFVRALKLAEARIKRIYNAAVINIAFRAAATNIQDKPFSLSLYPVLNRHIEAKINAMHKDIYREIVASVKRSWSLANSKTDKITDKRLAGKKPSARAKQILYDANAEALDKFITRKEKGLNLSDRVWKLLEPFKMEMEQGLGVELMGSRLQGGIGRGMSATRLASQMRRYLVDPDKLFRRVREIKGDPTSRLKLSRAALDYHPGTGVYRSSYKNALRLTRTETNIAYRTADFERWNGLPFITGFEVKLSLRHPVFDICDHLQGDYPKDFKFTGWHPQCLCFAVPKMISDEEYSKFEDQLLETGEMPATAGDQVSQPPAAFHRWVKENEQRIEGWKTKPYWFLDNQQYIPKKATT